MFKSEIRDSQINALLEKSGSRNYAQYLPKIVLKKVRGFQEEPITFDFPVTAIIGPNGGGKTTILGAAACAYLSISPRKYFAKSGKYDESMQDWKIEYELIDRKISPKDSIRRSATFKNSRWNRDAIERSVLAFGVQRTVPANERSELTRCQSSSFSVSDANVTRFTADVQKTMGRILGKDVSGFRELRVERSGKITLLTGKTSSGDGYSEFHFGAGESSIIRMIARIESSDDQSMILIEEIENGLHPVATVRLVEYLIEVAERKKVQVIFTTHSNDALRPLPTKAVWVATQDKIFQGKLDVKSLRAITGQIETQAVVFVEDDFAKSWVEAIFRQHQGFPVEHVQVHAMEGDGTAVAMNKYHNKNPSLTIPSICVIDGDSRQRSSSEDSVYRLPGEAPESHVFDTVMEAWDKISVRLTVALLERTENVARVKELCTNVRRQNMDPHLLYSQLGEQLSLLPEALVRAAFTNIWAQTYPDAVKVIIDSTVNVLPEALRSTQIGSVATES